MYQKYAVETIFLSLASKLGVQHTCLENKIGNIDLSYFLGYIGCVNGFLENIGEILDVRRGKNCFTFLPLLINQSLLIRVCSKTGQV